MKSMILICGTMLLASADAQAAKGNADSPAAAQVAPMKDMARCKAIIDDRQRLACYDQAATTLLAAEQRADIIVVDRQEVEQANRSLFGFSLPDIALFRSHGAAVEQVDQVEGVIASTFPDASGQWTIRLQDGAVWHQIDTNVMPRDPRPGQLVLIKRASLGSYRLSVDKAPAVRVRRIG